MLVLGLPYESPSHKMQTVLGCQKANHGPGYSLNCGNSKDNNTTSLCMVCSLFVNGVLYRIPDTFLDTFERQGSDKD